MSLRHPMLFEGYDTIKWGGCQVRAFAQSVATPFKKGPVMATERFNRQFILVDFEDLDNPEFMEFVRSPEFSTYLLLRRYVWRSDKPHGLGLHEYYAQGHLASSLSRERIAESLGGVTPRTVTKDINALIQRGVIKSITTGRGNIFILGKWAVDEEEGVYYEYFFLDRLQVRLEENFQAEEKSNLPGRKLPGREEKDFQTGKNPGNPGGRKLPGSMEENARPEGKEASSNNIEENIEENREEYSEKNNNSGDKTEPPQDVVVALTNLGIGKRTAQRLARHYGRKQVLEKIDFLMFLQEFDPGKVKNPRGWLRTAIEENYGPPDGYKPQEQREAEAAERERRQQEVDQAVAGQGAQPARFGGWQQWVIEKYSVAEDVWEVAGQLLESLKLQMPAATFDTWVSNTMLIELGEAQARIAVSSQRAYEWLEHRLKSKFEQVLAGITDRPMEVIFEVIERSPAG